MVSRVANEILSDEENFSPDDFLKLHKRLFKGVSNSAGVLRKQSMYKQLAQCVEGSLDFNFDEFQLDDLVKHFSKFIINL